MHFLKRFFDFYIFSNVHVALGVFCFVKITLISFDIDENSTAIFAFFGTVLGYNFIRFLNVPNQKNWMAKWFVENRVSTLVLSIISALICVYFSKDLSVNSLLTLAPFFIITFFYGVSLPKSLLSLRSVPGIKIFLIAFCFAGITVLFPLVQNGVDITLIIWQLFLQRIFFVILITIPFDIRDVGFDNQKLKTIPQYFGIRITKVVGVFIGVLVVFLEYNYALGSILITLIVSFVAVILLLFSNKNQSKYYSSFLVESIPIIWFVLLLAENNLNQ